jgi:uncharacterized protein YciI
MPEFAYVLRPCRPTLPQDASERERAIIGEHFNYLKAMLDAGRLVLAGRCEDATFGIAVFRAADEASARRDMDNDPAVRAGIMTATLYPFRIALLGR